MTVRPSLASRLLVPALSLSGFLACGGGGSGLSSQAAPRVAVQPEGRTIPTGNTATFTVAVQDPAGMAYQWQASTDGAVWVDLAQSTATTCQIQGLTARGQGWIQVRCTLTNAGGSIHSGAASLRVVDVIYVDASGAGWVGARTTVQDALAVAAAGSEIWVAQGTYVPGTTRDATFAMKAGVAVYGGFSGVETYREARAWGANASVLSGEIGAAGSADNCRHVVTGANNAVLDGFTITGGNADSTGGTTPPDGCGGGMFIDACNQTIANCTFTANNAASLGGGLANYSNPAPITGCTFTGNIAPSGAGMFSDACDNTISRCSFVNNAASLYGGGAYIHGGSPVFLDCLFQGNSATGGGALASNGSSHTLAGCVLSGNTAGASGGGALRHQGSGGNPILVVNCTCYGNTSMSWGGAMENLAGANVLVRNSILWWDAASSWNEIHDVATPPASTSVLTNCCVQGATPDPAAHLIAADPQLDANLKPRAGSPCIDTGDNAFVPAALTLDLAGNPRIAGGGVDMGAYEAQ